MNLPGLHPAASSHNQVFSSEKSHTIPLAAAFIPQGYCGSPSSHISRVTMLGHLAHQNLPLDFIIQPTDFSVSSH